MYADYLVHFNPNHDPKTGRFDFSRGEIRKFRKLEKDKNNAAYYLTVTSNKKVEKFKKNSDEYSELKNARSNRTSISRQIALEADKLAVEKLLTDDEKFLYNNIYRDNPVEQQAILMRVYSDKNRREQWHNLAIDVVKNNPKLKEMAKEADKRVNDAQLAYNKAAKEFVDNALGKYANIETTNPLRKGLNGKQQTLSESIVNQLIVEALMNNNR